MQELILCKYQWSSVDYNLPNSIDRQIHSFKAYMGSSEALTLSTTDPGPRPILYFISQDQWPIL